VSEAMGIYVLHNVLVGRYHKPKVEERIFMFLDMKSSTTIAENIGHVKYFEMLREYYSDLTQSIIDHSGEIYQYVGDEIVISWKLKRGLLNNNFLKCFYSMKARIRSQEEKYRSNFDVLPDFKAGIHLGPVTAGEIGVIKKDIIYTGDVLNATARIQGLCNAHNEDLLISDQLRREITAAAEYRFRTLGNIELRGRNKEMELYAVQLQN